MLSFQPVSGAGVAVFPLFLKMTVILKLQGLVATAGAEDVRSFFQDLHIPEGGVYIVGGKLREAFIAFPAERDAQLAMRHNGQALKGSKVTLKISSLQEVEKKLRGILEKKKKPLAIRPPSPADCPKIPNGEVSSRANSPPAATVLSLCEPSSARPPEPMDPPSPNKVDSSTAFLLGCYTVLQSLQPCGTGEKNDLLSKEDLAKMFTSEGSSDLGQQAASPPPGFVRLFGLPPSVTKEEICEFFRELNVEEVIVNVELGVKHGCLVRFSSEEEASSALRHSQRLLGSNCVELRGGTEKMWLAAMQNNHQATWDSRKTPNLPLSENANQRDKLAAAHAKRPCVDEKSSYPPRRRKPDFETSALSPDLEFSVMISNLPETMTKTDIKELLGCRNMMHKNVLHLLDRDRQRTDKAFVTFHNADEYDHALKLTGSLVGSNVIDISAISRKRMNLMLDKARGLTGPWIRPDSKKMKPRTKRPK